MLRLRRVGSLHVELRLCGVRREAFLGVEQGPSSQPRIIEAMTATPRSASTPPATKAKSRAEQETIIRMAADEQHWSVFSEDPRIIRKLSAKYGAGQAKGGGWLWSVPLRLLSFRALRILSAADRKRAADRLAAIRERRAKG